MIERDRYAAWVPRSLLLLPRLYLGLVFSIAAYEKAVAPHGFAANLAAFLNGVALHDGFAWYRPFVSAILLPNVHIFAALVAFGEAFVGLALLLGVVTRGAALTAIVLLLNYAFAKGLPPWSPASNDGADIVLALIVFFGRAGRTFGVDQMLRGRRRRR